MVNEKWRKLMVKEEKVRLSDDLEITIRGLSFKELGQLAQYQDSKDYMKAMTYLLQITLEKAPEIEDKSEIPELIANLTGDAGGKIIAKVQELSGFKAEIKNQDEQKTE